MKSLQVKRLRSLVDSGSIKLKPINILVGANSSGKSTFLRVFPLIKQSIETKTRGPILWNGEYTDFESFTNSMHTVDGERSDSGISFDFSFEYKNHKSNKRASTSGKPFEILTSILVKKGGLANTCYTSEYIVNIFDHAINLFFNEDGVITKIDSEKLLWEIDTKQSETTLKRKFKNQYTNTDTLLPIIRVDEFFRDGRNEQLAKMLMDVIVARIKEISGSSKTEKIQTFILRLCESFYRDRDKVKELKKLALTKAWENALDSHNDSEFRFVLALIDLYTLIEHSYQINAQLGNYFSNVKYIAPLRASTKRYYRYQDINVDELEPSGENIGVFLSNISDDYWRGNLNNWTSDNFGFEICEVLSRGHISIEIKFSSSNVADNITDMGFGFSQILPIIVQLWAVSSGYESRFDKSKNEVIFAIEQPELHLHPKMQAMLAQVFALSISLSRSNDINLTLIVETHSEALISKLGDLVSMSEISHNDISVKLFEKSRNDRKTTVRESYFSDDGVLNNWPSDFFSY